MSWSVEFHDAFDPEFDVLAEEVQEELLAQLKLLEAIGPSLGRPRVDTLNGSKHANMKELRFSTADGEWRAAFAFDPRRRAIVLVAGDKSGKARSASTSSSLPRRISGLMSTSPALRNKGNRTVGKTLNERLDKLPAARRAKVEARAQELLAEEMSLSDLRKPRKLTQVRMADLLGIGQEGISRLEKRSDLLLSTLRNYVSRMGGRLDLVVRFPDRPDVLLQDLTVSSTDAPPSPAPKKKRHRPEQRHR